MKAQNITIDINKLTDEELDMIQSILYRDDKSNVEQAKMVQERIAYLQGWRHSRNAYRRQIQTDRCISDDGRPEGSENMIKRIKSIAEVYCNNLERVLNEMDKKTSLTAEELSSVNDCIRVLGNLQVLLIREEEA